jgi:chemotaxis protein histidine kinase CheA
LAIDNGGDFMENFHKVFRAFHSIKDGSAIFGMEDLTKHMHVLEGLFESKREQSLSKAQIDYFLLGVDTSRVLLDRESVTFEFLSQEKFDNLDQRRFLIHGNLPTYQAFEDHLNEEE